MATRVGQHNNTHSATERLDSKGRADRRGAVGKSSATERMTDTTVTILYPNDPEGVTDDTILYLDDPEGMMRRSIVLAKTVLSEYLKNR